MDLATAAVEVPSGVAGASTTIEGSRFVTDDDDEDVGRYGVDVVGPPSEQPPPWRLSDAMRP